MTQSQDWLAIVLVGVGGSSYARGPDKFDTMKRVERICQSDWGSMIKPGTHKVTAYVYDVSGRSKLWWDTRGVFSDEDEALGPVPEGEPFEITLKGKK